MRRTIALAAVAAAALVVATGASAINSWGGYHWARTSNPFTLELGDNVTSAWDSYLATTSSDWSASTVLDTTIVAGGSHGKQCRATSGRVEVCNGTYGNNGWLGLAQIWITGGTHIAQGVVKVNDTYFNTPTYNTPVERNHVMCQEVGHTLGLDHQSTSGADLGTCMDYSSSVNSQHPNAHDYQQLQTIYNSHTDSFTTLGATTGSLPDAVPSWAPATQQSQSVYVDRLPNGDELVTFVVWANPIRPSF